MLPDGYGLRELTLDDAAAMAGAYRRNREHLAPWDPAREDAFFTEAGQEAVVAGQLAAVRSGHVAAWVIEHEGRVAGRINLNNIVRGVLRSGSLGYWVDAGHLGRGVASGAVEEVCGLALRQGLHRVDAGTLTHNVASQRVLLACGFEHYGTAPRFLFIAGSWQDHHLYQRILHDEPL